MASSQCSSSQTYDSNGLHDFLVNYEPKKGNEQSKNQHQQPEPWSITTIGSHLNLNICNIRPVYIKKKQNKSIGC